MKAFRTLGLVLLAAVMTLTAMAQSAGELRFCLRSEPRTFDPLLVSDEASDTVRYLTGGVLVRINRQTQTLEPELASSWKVSKDSRSISFALRDRIFYSDGSPFTADDVAATVKRMMAPETHSPMADAFGAGGEKTDIKVLSPTRVTITFAAPIAGLDRLFDEVAIVSSRSPRKEMAALGPYYVADHKAGSYVYLRRNPNYWKKDSSGQAMPYIEAIRLDIQANRDIELLRMQRGEIHLINSLDAEYFDRLKSINPSLVYDAGPSLDSEQMWFNQVPNAPVAAYKLKWFRSSNFRHAVSMAINRADLARIVFGSHAQPAIGPVSPANKFWFNRKLRPTQYDTGVALRQLQQDGFRLNGGVLRDREGHAVEFSVITNAGNKYRERMATMIQQDLGKIGIRLNIVTLDFPSLIERIAEKFNYEAALLGTVNAGLDPNEQMNMWLSSGENHQWNPRQKSPETTWEAEIDRAMKAQSQLSNPMKRKVYFDRVQEIVVREAPFIYLVNRNALSAISTSIRGAAPVAMRPQAYWNIERMSLTDGKKVH